MDGRRAKGLCFNWDKKYSKGHKCSEKKSFYIDFEDEDNQEVEPSQDLNSEETTPALSCHAFASIVTLKAPNTEGYIKNKKVVVLIDLGCTHNFIKYRLLKVLNFFVYPVIEFQVINADGVEIPIVDPWQCNKLKQSTWSTSITNLAEA